MLCARAGARFGAARLVAPLWRCTACLAVHLHRSCTLRGRVTCVELVSTRLAWVSFLARNAALANFKQPWGRRRVWRARPVSIGTATLHRCGSHRRARLVHQDCIKQSQQLAHRARRGRFGGVVGGTACTACSIGQYADAVGSVVCKQLLNAYGLGAAAKVSFEAECGLCPSGDCTG